LARAGLFNKQAHWLETLFSSKKGFHQMVKMANLMKK